MTPTRDDLIARIHDAREMTKIPGRHSGLAWARVVSELATDLEALLPLLEPVGEADEEELAEAITRLEEAMDNHGLFDLKAAAVVRPSDLHTVLNHIKSRAGQRRTPDSWPTVEKIADKLHELFEDSNSELEIAVELLTLWPECPIRAKGASNE